MSNAPVFGMLSSPVPGHLYPMSAVAIELKKRGYRVVYFTIPDSAKLLEEMDIEVVEFGHTRFPKGSWRQKWLGVSNRIGLRAAINTVRIHRELASASCESLPLAISQRGVTHLILDQNQYQAPTIAEFCGLPFVQLTCTVPLNRGRLGEIAPPSEAWLPAKSAFSFHRLANAFAFWCVELSVLPITMCARGLAQKKGLKRRHFIEQTFGKDLTISGILPELNWSRYDLGITYVGHLIGNRKLGESPAKLPFELPTDKRVIFVSLGTLSTGLHSVIEEIVQALTGLDIFFVISLGRWQEQGSKVIRFSNGVAVDFVPQLEMLKHTNLFINHAGINSVMESLLQGVPLLLLPITNDQPGMAARAQSAGVAEVLHPRKWKAKHIRAAVLKMLSESNFHLRAQAFKNLLNEAGGPAMAAHLIESWAMTRTVPRVT